jgi:DNA-binding CsgD family transcriptional regulator
MRTARTVSAGRADGVRRERDYERMTSLSHRAFVLNSTTRSHFTAFLLAMPHLGESPAPLWPAPEPAGVAFYHNAVAARFSHRLSPPPPKIITVTIIEPAPGHVLVTADCHDQQYAAAFAALLATVARHYPEAATDAVSAPAPMEGPARQEHSRSETQRSEPGMGKAFDNLEWPPLRARDRKIVEQWRAEHTAGEIAESLGLAEKTVNNRISHLRKQYGTVNVPLRRSPKAGHSGKE